MKNEVKKVLEKYIDVDFAIEVPKDSSLGHFATPVAFSLAKTLRKSPMIIASELATKLQKEDIFQEVSDVKGYINFKLNIDFLDKLAQNAINDEVNFAKDNVGEKILLEYVSANPTGPLHIGHTRGAVFGDSLACIGKHLGYDITTEYYVNDAGNQINLLGVSIFLSGKANILKQDVTYPQEYYKGEYIDDVALQASSEFGNEVFESEENIEKLSSWAKEKMLELIKQNLKEVDISFDSFVSEQELFNSWDKTFEKLKQNQNSTYEKDRVIVRDDGRPTYLAGDIIYHNNKFQRKFDRYINVWGADHHGYISRVKAAISYLGYDESKLEVLLAQMVSLLQDGQPFKMSKRAGTFVLMSDVVEHIGKDALRFIFLSKKSDTHLEFDINTLKNQDSSNPVFYVNYAHARINQIFNKANKTPKDVVDVNFTSLNEDAKSLLFQALFLKETLTNAFESRELQKVTDYLKSLASSLHKFYNANKIVGSNNENELLKLLAVVAVSLRVGLKLIGIEAKEKM